jgi:hypothetical protein
MATAASTALPPCWKIIAPAVAESGFPVTATQFLPCSTGRSVFCAPAQPVGMIHVVAAIAARNVREWVCIARSCAGDGFTTP